MPSQATLPTIRSVLVVDDSGAQRAYAVALCHELGITDVREASNGLEALALLGAMATPPDLLIIDLEMPTMDGPELLTRLRERGIESPIIVASSRERALLHSVLDMGGGMGLCLLGALQKPLRLETLSAILRNWDSVAEKRKSKAHSLPVDPDALRAGIDRGEIVVHYQPQIAVHSGDLHGVEALARWHHPTLGVVHPDHFIPMAEEHGLIHKLTLQVMNQAMLQTSMWNAEGMDLSVAINLSPVLLESPELLQEISGLQQCYGLRAEQVVLEITETSLMRELSVALAVLTRLRLRGFGLSLDDYGTGFSSMQQLARIPFTELKIDRSFVHGVHERESVQVMLRSALEMAMRLGLNTVAEGVESMQDWRLLQEYGCTFVQGWLTGKAMPAADVCAWARAHEERKPGLRPQGSEVL
ncbi:MAG TPA: EAL domain-containing response regulator [Steroidobacteraceae bacterium]|nr:EAL domain-containing response regulator [Steroidobacteraceae bacterium]